jgi:polar amino acid transport system permease protein
MRPDLTKPDAVDPLRQLDAKDIVRTPKPRQWVGTVIALLLVSMFVHMLVTNTNLQWNVVGQYLFSHEILSGVGLTLELTLLAMLACCSGSA